MLPMVSGWLSDMKWSDQAVEQAMNPFLDPKQMWRECLLLNNTTNMVQRRLTYVEKTQIGKLPPAPSPFRPLSAPLCAKASLPTTLVTSLSTLEMLLLFLKSNQELFRDLPH